MKKFFLVAFTFVFSMAMALPSWAIESQFGGYWRTRAYAQTDFKGKDTGTNSVVDTRTRLYYTAKFSDKFKFVNKFEFDPVWGDNVGGDVGTDGQMFEIKNSYVDFNVGDHNVKVGLQPGYIARGFMIDEDFAGVTFTANLGNVSLPIMWARVSDSDLDNGYDPNFAFADPADPTAAELLAYEANEARRLSKLGTTRDYLAINPVINIDENMSVNPFLVIDKEQGTETNIYSLGADVKMKMDPASIWGTLIYQAGKNADADVSAFLLAAGADAGLVHGQFFYASGDDTVDDKDKSFNGLAGTTYYWSEIMGLGILGDTGSIAGDMSSNGAPGTAITNIMAFNVGATIKPMDKLTLKGDVWYAALAEDDAAGETELGIEIDLMATYAIMDNLNIDVVAAYLIAGDAFGEDDATEIGTRLSFGF